MIDKPRRTRPVRRRTKFNGTPIPTKRNTKTLLIIDHPKNFNKKEDDNDNGKLTPKQSKFVDEYLIDLNATQAAIRAGYSKKTAFMAGHQNIKKYKVANAIQKRRNKLSATARIDQEWVLKRYEMLSEYSITDFINDDGSMKPFSQIPKEKLYAIGGFKQSKRTISKSDEKVIIDRIKEFKLPEKKSVLDSIGKHLGIFKDDDGPKGGIHVDKAIIHIELVN